MVTVADRILVKVDRAEENIDVLQKAVHTYMRTYFDNLPAEIVPTSQSGTAQLGITMPISPNGFGRHAAIIGDVIHDLRSALDHLAWELVKANGGTPTHDTYFPIKHSPPACEGDDITPPPTVVGGIGIAVAEILATFQPYSVNASDPTSTDIWHLQRLSIEDKHHGLLLAPLYMDRANLVASSMGRVTGILRSNRFHDDGADFAFEPDHCDTSVNGTISLSLCLGDGLPGQGSPVVTKMRAFLALVRDDICGSLFTFV